MFTLVLENMFKKLHSETEDYPCLIKDKQELIGMLEKPQDEAAKLELYMNYTKTQTLQRHRQMKQS